MQPNIDRVQIVAASLAASPAVALALVGLAHPRQLTIENAGRWYDVHVGLLVLFPLLALPLVWFTRTESLQLRAAVGALSFLYAVFYGAQDAIAGVGLGAVVDRATPQDVADVNRLAGQPLFSVGNGLARIGLWCFLAAAVLTSAAMLRRWRLRALLGTLLVSGAGASFLTSHIYWPRGVLTMLVIGAAFAALTLAPKPPSQPLTTTTANPQKHTRSAAGPARKKPSRR